MNHPRTPKAARIWFPLTLAVISGCITQASVGGHDGGTDRPSDASTSRDVGPSNVLPPVDAGEDPCNLLVCGEGQQCCPDCPGCIPDSVNCIDVVCLPDDAGAASPDAGTCDCPTGQHCCPGCRGSTRCTEDGIPCPMLNCEHCVEDCGPSAICCPTCNLQGECIPLEETCREPMIRPCICEIQDAFGYGVTGCTPRILGWKWSADGCEVVEACTCRGTDCGRLYDSAEQCELGCGYP